VLERRCATGDVTGGTAEPLISLVAFADLVTAIEREGGQEDPGDEDRQVPGFPLQRSFSLNSFEYA
jgi:hypothetical protein